MRIGHLFAITASACSSGDKSENTETPSDGSGITDSIDTAIDTANAQHDTYEWGELIEEPAEVFFARDLSEAVRDGVTQGLAHAAVVWGNYGPLEYWVLGTDTEAAETLIDEFCTRRDERGDWDKATCVEFHSNTSGPPYFMGYLALGQSVIANDQPTGSAGMNGQGRDWGIFLFGSSYPYAFDNLFDYVAPEEETKVLFHEYFHAVQHAHIYTLDHQEREALLGPVWFNEGGAEFMAQFTTTKLIENGTIEPSGVPWDPFEDRMQNLLEQSQSILEQLCPEKEMKDVTASDPCSGAAYGLGGWAHAYLVHLTGPDVLLETFYPSLEDLGWESAFEQAYGRSPDAFYVEFDAFLALPAEERLTILPEP